MRPPTASARTRFPSYRRSIKGRLDNTSYLTRLTDQTRRSMKSWPVQDAKARFSEMLETCLNEGPQLITRRGADAAVLVPVKDWRRLKRAAKPTLKQLLLADFARGDLNVPERGDKRRRAPHDLVGR